MRPRNTRLPCPHNLLWNSNNNNNSNKITTTTTTTTPTVKKFVFPLHPDKRTSTPTTEQNYGMALSFLTEIALTAFNTNTCTTREYHTTTPAN